jgi:hypothetical protein
VLGGPGVVKHHQHPLAGEQAAEAGSALGLIGGNPGFGNPQRAQEARQCLGGP